MAKYPELRQEIDENITLEAEVIEVPAGPAGPAPLRFRFGFRLDIANVRTGFLNGEAIYREVSLLDETREACSQGAGVSTEGPVQHGVHAHLVKWAESIFAILSDEASERVVPLSLMRLV